MLWSRNVCQCTEYAYRPSWARTERECRLQVGEERGWLQGASALIWSQTSTANHPQHRRTLNILMRPCCRIEISAGVVWATTRTVVVWLAEGTRWVGQGVHKLTIDAPVCRRCLPTNMVLARRSVCQPYKNTLPACVIGCLVQVLSHSCAPSPTGRKRITMSVSSSVLHHPHSIPTHLYKQQVVVFTRNGSSVSGWFVHAVLASLAV